MNRRQSEGRARSAHAIARTKATDHKPMTGDGDDRPEIDVGRDWVGGNGVERRVGHDEARRLRGDQRGRKRGKHQPQSQRSPQHFERKQRAAERHAIDRGHPGAGADRDHQAALFVRELLKAREQIAEHRPELLRARLRGRAERPCRRSRSTAPRCRAFASRHAAGLKPDRRRDVDAVAAGEPGQQPLAQAGHKPGGEQQTDMALGGSPVAPLRAAPKARRAPGELLRRVEQQRQKGRAETGAEPGQNDGDPEADRARDRASVAGTFAPAAGSAAPRRRTLIPVSNARLRMTGASSGSAPSKRLAREAALRKGGSRQLAPLAAFL